MANSHNYVGVATNFDPSTAFNINDPASGDPRTAAAIQECVEPHTDAVEYFRQRHLDIVHRHHVGASWVSWTRAIAASNAWSGNLVFGWSGATAPTLVSASATWNAPRAHMASPLNGNVNALLGDSGAMVLTATTAAVFNAMISMSSVGANNNTIQFGVWDNSSRGAWYEKASTDTNWKCITNDGTATTTTTSTPPIANTPQRLRMEMYGTSTAPGKRVRFYIDDVLVANHTTHVDTTTACGPAMLLTATTNNAVTFDLGPIDLSW